MRREHRATIIVFAVMAALGAGGACPASESWQDDMTKGRAAEKQGRWRDAAALFEDALKFDAGESRRQQGDLSSDHADLGYCLFKGGDPAAAAKAYDRSIELKALVYGRNHPYVGIVLSQLSEVLSALNDTAGAKRAADESNRSLPPCPKCKSNRSVRPIQYGIVSCVVSPRENMRRECISAGCAFPKDAPGFSCESCRQKFGRPSLNSEGHR